MLPTLGQGTFPVNGVHDERESIHAFTNARIVASAYEEYNDATLLVQDGKVLAVGSMGIPDAAIVHDCKGFTIYPAFIDAYASLSDSKGKTAITQPSYAGNWNPAVHPEFRFSPALPANKKRVDDWLGSGFGLVNVHHRDGIMRGNSALIRLGVEEPNQAFIGNPTQHFSFSKGTSKNDYPSSHIGAVALIRQTLYDADWYEKQPQTEERNTSLKALAGVRNQTNVFELNNALSIRNVHDIESEFGVSFILFGTGKEYLALDQISEETRLILPMAMPRAMDVADPYEARKVDLAQLKHWEAARFNMRFVQEAGAQVALSRDTIKKAASFVKSLAAVKASGVSELDILKALTETPATFLGVAENYGSLTPGKSAEFVVCSSSLGEKDFSVVENWSGENSVFSRTLPDQTLVGTYNLVIEQQDYQLKVTTTEKGKLKAECTKVASSEELIARLEVKEELVSITLIEKGEAKKLLYQLSGKLSLNGNLWDGKGQTNSGSWVEWAAIKDRKSQVESKPNTTSNDSVELPVLWHPNVAYGWDSIDSDNTFLITNARIWTCADTGIIERADILVEDGKIKSISSNGLYPNEIRRIDAKGRNVTPGIVDEHSHIGLRGGVNESGQAISAEVRISDALNPANINLYRQLAGGVTSAQLLHGSANPIGGQSAIVKYKWGAAPQDMLIEDAPGFIKFALGENVKRSNSKDHKNRYPLTRMGVEQVFEDAFVRAEEYRENPDSRRDLELDALAEILDAQRFISCHSYVQSEILMLMEVAKRHDFRVNTFTHILEGYKVADSLAHHGASGSTFSDWWAYKYEVKDAIPYNAALMHEAGVNVGINSDDAEMGRRLNQEAAKVIKYGGVSQEEALKMITINPAKMLHIDHRLGSIEVGKDADIVIWSDNPLSVYSQVDQTYIEGVKYFDRKDNKDLEARNTEERARIIEKMILDKTPNKAKPNHKPEAEYHCDTILDNGMHE